MRILLLTETIPFPLDSGGRIKTYHTLRALSSRHEVHCHAFIRHEDQRRYAADLTPHCAALTLHLMPATGSREVRALARSLVTGMPFTVARHFDRAALKLLRAQNQAVHFDAAYYDHLSMLAYRPHLRLPAIHDAHNLEFRLVQRYAQAAGTGPRRWFSEREWRVLRRYEQRAYADCNVVLAVSEVDARGIRALAGPDPPVRVLPIAVDAAGTVPVDTLTRDPSLLLIGGLHWPPNADAARHFVEETWPLVRRDTPEATLTVVGRDDAGVARLLRRTPGVRVTGYVADVAPFFARARAVVVPLRSGGGMRAKILETLARGVPVVSTTLGFEGIDAVPGVHLLAADSPAEFARHVQRLFRDDSLAVGLAHEGRRLVLERYDAAVVGGQLLDVLDDMTALRPGRDGGRS